MILTALLWTGALASSPSASPTAAAGGALRSGPGLIILAMLIGGLFLLRRRIGRR